MAALFDLWENKKRISQEIRFLWRSEGDSNSRTGITGLTI